MTRLVPVASDPVERLADWLETQALTLQDRVASLESLVSVIRRSGSVDAFDDDDAERPQDQGSEVSQQIASDALSETEARAKACGGRYPFEIEQGLLRLKDKREGDPYIFLLLLSLSRPTAGHNGTAVLFEHVCTHAARQYLGGVAKGAEAIRFGSPRKAPKNQFGAALDDLCCRYWRAAAGSRPKGRATRVTTGWTLLPGSTFRTAKPGKLMAFGQCAAGEVTWGEKLNELDGSKFARKWFREALVVDPIRLFFVPRCVPVDLWRNTGIDAGIVFDRCRIAACLDDLEPALIARCGVAAASLSKKL